MNKHKVIAPDGSLHKRVSQNRVYTHTVMGQHKQSGKWINLGWCSSAELARKLYGSRKCSYYNNVTIFEAEKG